MSQIQARTKTGLRTIFGIDRALGWFVTIYDAEGEPLLERDQVFTKGFGKSKLLEILERELEMTPRLEYALKYIALDLDPQKGIDKYEELKKYEHDAASCNGNFAYSNDR
jgi:hypothetical protein